MMELALRLCSRYRSILHRVEKAVEKFNVIGACIKEPVKVEEE